MKRLPRVATIVIALMNPLIACALDIDSLVDEWTAKHYDTVLPELITYRQGAQGRNWKVDYMIGTSWCHGTQHSRRGIPYLANVLQYKDAPPTARSFTQREITYCNGNATSDDAAESAEPAAFQLVPISGQSTDPAGVYGKGGYNMMYLRNPITTTTPRLTPVSLSELRKRIYYPDQSEAAIRAAADRLGQQASGLVSNGFLVVCSRFCDSQLSAKVAKCLTGYEAPLKQEFNIAPPAALVTVYLPTDLRDLPTFARKLHGVELPLGVLAYSVVADLSIAGIYVEPGCGSLAHELVHLSMKGNFGDSPAWLEEGLASEVAVSAPQSDGFHFAANWDNWRNTMLSNQWSLRPNVGQLLSMTWSDFSTSDPAQLNRVAAIHSMAAVFVQYLDARRKLQPIYVALRDRRFSDQGEDRPTSGDIVQAQLGKELEAVDADFVAWFQAKGHGVGSAEH